jgi:DNA-binding HxlR family transcriptional regulator
MRFCELQQDVGGVNPRTLSQRLQFLRAEGLVELRPAGGVARHALTQAGSHLVALLDSLRNWQSTWLPAGRTRGSPSARLRPIQNKVTHG